MTEYSPDPSRSRLLPLAWLVCSMAVTGCSDSPSPTHPEVLDLPRSEGSCHALSNCTKTVDGVLVFESRIPEENGEAVFSIRPDGSDLRQLTEGFDDLNGVHAGPRGRIVFSARQAGSYDIFLMESDGSSLIQLTNTMEQEFSPVLSPTGDKFAFSRETQGLQQIWVATVDAPGSATRVTTGGAGGDNYVDWAPDGSTLAFARNFGGSNWEVYTVGVDGSGERRLTFNLDNDAFPEWSPDGSRIAFASSRGGNWDVYAVDPDGSGLTRVTSDPTIDSHPTWSPDGSEIAFTVIHGADRFLYRTPAQGTELGRQPILSTEGYSPTASWGGVVDPAVMADCRRGGWVDFGFRNQGQCIRFLKTGKDSR
ncbi:MAG: hypothetical protein RJQ04_01095 [Longimicrobiales bacterium]